MGDGVACAKFEARTLKSGWGWFVYVTLPDGSEEHIVGFRTEADANEWIAAKSSAWLADRSSQRRSRGEIA
jgi:hypothetical protein